MNNNFLIFKALLARDLKVTLVNFRSIIIDACINVTCFILIFAHFLPALGMDRSLSAPLFLGTNVITIISLSYTRMVRIKSDIEFKHFINYHFTLPITKSWLLAEYVLAFIFDITISILPALILGLILIDGAVIFKFNPFAFVLIFLISLIFIAISFLFLAFKFSWVWLINNTWERMLSPLTQLGCLFFMWQNLEKFSPLLSKFILLNPVTYISEGLRASLFGTEKYLPILVCLLVLLFSTIIMAILMWRAMKKRMDPV